jgi:peptidoglycan/LPS O-acetylase OafA/YrhL
MKESQGSLVIGGHGEAVMKPTGAASADAAKSEAHIAVLDGWRGISILLVLATHLFPMGPKEWKLAYVSGVMGMVIFFILSGFLITMFLLREPSVARFITRRIFRIVPLAWLYLTVTLLLSGAAPESWVAHFLFYANLPPQQLVPLTAHLWSVCLEVQFYVGIAVLVAVLGQRGLLLIPLLCLSFTAIRIVNEVYASSITYFRFDEILAGCLLALVYSGRFGEMPLRIVRESPQILLLPLLFLTCFLQGEWTNYFRPYVAALLVGATLVNPRGVLGRLLHNRALSYVAGISYALYVLHPLLAHSWLGSGTLIEKYAKRPLLFVALFVLAHFSTYSFERRWIAFGRKLSNRFGNNAGGRT